jgi:GxxExxY protein
MITEQIIGAAFEVHNELGFGFLEKVYQKAMQVELIQRGLKVEREHAIKVFYRGAEVGTYSADLFVEDSVIVELKIAKTYNKEDEPQLLNELKATGIKVGMLINFGRDKVEHKRMVF